MHDSSLLSFLHDRGGNASHAHEVYHDGWAWPWMNVGSTPREFSVGSFFQVCTLGRKQFKLPYQILKFNGTVALLPGHEFGVWV
eukprot:353737-Rhodomonas_salina.1